MLERVAGSVADSEEPDWETIRNATPRVRNVVDQLRQLSRISHTFLGKSQVPLPEEGAGRAPRVWGHLEIGRLLGEGSYAKTFLAFDPNLEREVALKLHAPQPEYVGSADYLQKTLDEARRLAKVRHPNVVLVFGADSFGGQAGIWTELIRGESMSEFLKRERLVDWVEAARIGVEIASALAAVHDADLLHGDVKPSNLLQEPGGRTVLIDFGSARYLSEDLSSVVTTPFYAAPEVLSGSNPTSAADLYSLGAILFNLLTGEPHIEAESMSELLDVHESERYRSLAEFDLDIPSTLRTCIERALEPDLKKRYSTAHEMLRALATVVEVSASELRHNLPLQPNPFIGRDALLEDLAARVSGGSLTTLTGFGGVGKTRVALEFARRIVPNLSAGAWWVELGLGGEETSVLRRTLESLGIAEDAGETIEDRLHRFLRGKNLLLVFDNCEHRAAECAKICQAILRVHANVRILCTSRVPFGGPSERVVQIPPLMVAPDGDAGELLKNESVHFFLDRATRGGASWDPSDENVSAVRVICEKLEGIPLALELAAARASMLTFSQIAARLEERFSLLASESAVEVPHHRSLLASLLWSYELLSPDEKTLLHRLAVFPGTWSLEAAEAVCPGQSIVMHQILDLATGLMRKAFIESTRESRKFRRFGLLQVVREFVHTQGAGSVDLRERHATYFLNYAEQSVEWLEQGDREAAIRELGPDEANFFRAFDTFDKAGDTERAMRLMLALGLYWLGTHHLSDAHVTCKRLLEGDLSEIEPLVVAKLQLITASLDMRTSMYASAGVRSEEALATFREYGDKRGIAHALGRLGGVASRTGDFDLADRYLNESLTHFEEIGARSGSCEILATLGNLRKVQGRGEEACHLFDRAIELGEREHYLIVTVQARIGKGGACWDLGRNDEAKQLFGEALQSLEGSRDVVTRAIVLQNLATASVEEPADYRRALFREAIELHRRSGDRRSLGLALLNLSAMSSSAGSEDFSRIDEAIDLFRELDQPLLTGYALLTLARLTEGAGLALYVRCVVAVQQMLEKRGALIPPGQRGMVDRPLREFEEAHGKEELERIRAEGLEWDVDRAWGELRGARRAPN